ncbi:MAG TPA: substrate-binding domain-containing protein [Kofleriaceae bacterium]|nr:substrate-binding domain-containing protein [Kofleriaceae bacterium]
MRRRISIEVVGVLSLAALALACGKKEKDKGGEKEAAQAEPAAPAEGQTAPAAAEGEAAPAGAKKKIGMSQCNLGEPWRVQMNADVKKAADEHPELEVIYKDAQNDSLVQRSHVEEFVAQKVDLIIISPKEAAPLTEPVAKAFEAGIPVIVLDRAVLGDKYTSFIGADNVKIGREAGKWVAKTLGGKGAIVELKGLMTSTPGQDRHKGFIEGLDQKANPGLKIVFDADMKWLEPDARKEMESALARVKKIDVVYAHNDPGTHGAYLAAKQAGREKEMKFVGIDALPHEGVQYVKDGIMDVTFQYPTGGAEAIDFALKIFAGEQVEKKMVLPTRVFSKDTLEQGGELVQ